MPNPNKVKIEKGIPIPTLQIHSGKWRDVLMLMKPGDSFALPVQTSGAANILKTSIRYFVSRDAKGQEFIVQKDAKGVYRCWRSK
jgi:hypothetical protein